MRCGVLHLFVFVKVVRMTEKYDIIWDFCDWLGYQGLAYETLYYGMRRDIDRLIKRYLEDEEWHNRKSGDGE